MGIFTKKSQGAGHLHRHDHAQMVTLGPNSPSQPIWPITAAQ
jgi:hypothetical protein